jgi:hypothetical protein
MHPLSRLFVAVPFCLPLSCRAGEFAQAPPVPGMALTRSDPGMANSAPAPAPVPAAVPAPVPAPEPAAAAPVPAPSQADLTGGRRRLRALGTGFPSIDGQLPNQRTGTRHQHVVRDICIGC